VTARLAWARWAGLAAALCLLNVALTFHNVWPTPAVRPVPELSIELMLVLLAVLGWAAWRDTLPAQLPAALAAAWLLLAVARYLEVTAPALYGRPVNLYWDLHCWEFNASWIPNGFRQSISVRVNVKASILKDLKVDQRVPVGGGGGSILR